MESSLNDLLDKMFTPELMAELEAQSVQKANECLDHTTKLVAQSLDSDGATVSRNAQIARAGQWLFESLPPEPMSMLLSVAIFRAIDAAKESE